MFLLHYCSFNAVALLVVCFFHYCRPTIFCDGRQRGGAGFEFQAPLHIAADTAASPTRGNGRDETQFSFQNPGAVQRKYNFRTNLLVISAC